MNKFEEETLASVINFLLQGNENNEAELLLSCSSVNVSEDRGTWEVILYGSRMVYEAFKDWKSTTVEKINAAFRAVLHEDTYRETEIIIRAKAETVVITPDWRKQIREQIGNQPPINQAVGSHPVELWNGLRFRSPAELAIAKALEAAGVMYFPNALGRLNNDPEDEVRKRVNREPDFLVCINGKWGILEVDGATFHTSAAKDHERSRLFRNYGIKVVEHYDAVECIQNPRKIVSGFLRLVRDQ